MLIIEPRANELQWSKPRYVQICTKTGRKQTRSKLEACTLTSILKFAAFVQGQNS